MQMLPDETAYTHDIWEPLYGEPCHKSASAERRGREHPRVAFGAVRGGVGPFSFRQQILKQRCC